MKPQSNRSKILALALQGLSRAEIGRTLKVDDQYVRIELAALRKKGKLRGIDVPSGMRPTPMLGSVLAQRAANGNLSKPRVTDEERAMIEAAVAAGRVTRARAAWAEGCAPDQGGRFIAGNIAMDVA